MDSPGPAAPSAAAHAASAPRKALDFLSSLRLPAGEAGLRALAAAMGEALPLTRAGLSAIGAAARVRKDEPLAFRLAARALALGRDPEAAVRSFFEAADPPPTGRGEGEGRGDGSEGAGADTGSGAAGAGTGRGGSGDEGRRGGNRPDEADEADEPSLAAALRSSVASALADERLSGLSSVAPDGSRWLCAPFSVSYAGAEFSGYIRARLTPSMARAERVVLDLRSGGGRRLVELGGPGARPRLRYCADSEAERAAFMGEFGGRWDVSAAATASSDLEELELFDKGDYA